MSSQLFQALHDGVMTVGDTHLYPFADAARAHADLEPRRTTGKVLLPVKRAQRSVPVSGRVRAELPAACAR